MVHDQLNRPLRNLRLSVTDRCNLRCQYCMPEMDYVWLPREDMLHFEEISRLVDVFLALGVNHWRYRGLMGRRKYSFPSGRGRRFRCSADTLGNGTADASG